MLSGNQRHDSRIVAKLTTNTQIVIDEWYLTPECYIPIRCVSLVPMGIGGESWSHNYIQLLE